MKKLILILVGLLFVEDAHAAQLNSARVTQTVNDVQLLPGAGSPRPASVGDVVEGATAVKTGRQSRTELVFADSTIARLGSLSLFSFTQGTRDIDLSEGTILLRVPPNSGGAKIRTAAVTAGITGTTVLVSVSGGIAKFIVLEGTMRIFLPDKPGESRLIEAGQMIMLPVNSKVLPEVVDVNLELLMETSKLITGFDPLPSSGLIQSSIDGQRKEIKKGDLVKTNLLMLGSDTRLLFEPSNQPGQFAPFVLENAASTINTLSNSASPPKPNGVAINKPNSTPIIPNIPPVLDGKFGIPEVYAGVFNINNSSLIITDPVIRTPVSLNDGTLVIEHRGKIYRGVLLDGPPSQYMLGVGLHPLASEFDALVYNAGQTAVFRFQALEISGSPQIITEDGPASVALVGMDGLTVNGGGSESSMDFSDLNNLILVSRADLGMAQSNISANALGIYAREAIAIQDSDLSVGSEGTVDLISSSATLERTSVSGDSSYLTVHDLRLDSVYLEGDAVKLESRNGSVWITSDAFSSSLGGGTSLTIRAADEINITGSEGTVFLNAATVTLTADVVNLNRTIVGNLPSFQEEEIPVGQQGVQEVTMSSTALTGTGINISNSSQIYAAMEGGTITATTAGANITVSDSQMEAENIILQAGGPLSSSIVAMQNVSLNAAQRVFIYAGGGSGGRIQFGPGSSSITSGTGTIMAARTLQFDSGANVDFAGSGSVYFFGDSVTNNGNVTRNQSPTGTLTPSGPYGNRPAAGSQGAINGTPMIP